MRKLCPNRRNLTINENEGINKVVFDVHGRPEGEDPHSVLRVQNPENRPLNSRTGRYRVTIFSLRRTIQNPDLRQSGSSPCIRRVPERAFPCGNPAIPPRQGLQRSRRSLCEQSKNLDWHSDKQTTAGIHNLWTAENNALSAYPQKTGGF